MEIERKQKLLANIDSQLVGDWSVGGPRSYKISSDGTFYVVDKPWPYGISPDGQTLIYPSPGSTIYQRTLGSGNSLLGVWEYTEIDGSDTWIEEWYFRANGTYTSQYTLNGAFESEYHGSYVDTVTHLQTSEIRSIIETNAPDTMIFHDVNSVSHTGTYSVAPSGDKWTFHFNGTDTIYTRLP